MDAATLIARLPPWDLLAMERKRIFYRLQDCRMLGALSVENVKEIKLEERSRLVNGWKRSVFFVRA